MSNISQTNTHSLSVRSCAAVGFPMLGPLLAMGPFYRDRIKHSFYFYHIGSDDTLRSVFHRAKPKDSDAAAADVAPFIYQGSMAQTAGNFIVSIINLQLSLGLKNFEMR